MARDLARAEVRTIVRYGNGAKYVTFENVGLARAAEAVSAEEPPFECGPDLDAPVGRYIVRSRSAALEGRVAYWYITLDPERGVPVSAHSCPARAANPRANIQCRHIAAAWLCWKAEHDRDDPWLRKVESMNESATALVPFEGERAVTVYHVPTRQEISDTLALGKVLMETRGAAIPKTLDTPQKAAAVILAGRELGFDPMTSFRHIFIVDGQTQPDGQALAALIQKSGADIVYHCDCETCADVELVRPGRPSVRVKYTMEMAERAGSTETNDWQGGRIVGKKKKPAWANHPADMLIWKAIARLARRGAADLVNAVSSSMVRLDDYDDAARQVTVEALHDAATDDRPALTADDDYDDASYTEAPTDGTVLGHSAEPLEGVASRQQAAQEGAGRVDESQASSAPEGGPANESAPAPATSSGPAWLDLTHEEALKDRAVYPLFTDAMKSEGQSVGSYQRAVGGSIGQRTLREILAWASGGAAEHENREGVRN